MKNIIYAIPLMLVGLMAGTQLAYATNESSYKIGFNGAVTLYHCFAHRPTAQDEDCGMVSNSSPSYECWSDKSMTNTTACNDGYIAGFVHWCTSDENGCISIFKSNAQPYTADLTCGRNITCTDLH
jgi:hypothetical protein